MSRRPARSLRRKSAQRQERRTVLVVTEGQTEKEYIEGLKQHLHDLDSEITPFKVVDGRGEPSRVLRTAKSRAREGDYDDVWLMMDVDDHAKLPPVLEEARKVGFLAAISNPCFEVWVVWHFRKVPHECKRQELHRLARSHGVDKSIPPNFPFHRRVDAERRASQRAVEVNHVGPNPSTGFPRLLERLCVSAVAPMTLRGE